MSEVLRFSCTMHFVCDICEHTLCVDAVNRSAGRGAAIDKGWTPYPETLCPVCKELSKNDIAKSVAFHADGVLP
jgi:hypothetical protein